MCGSRLHFAPAPLCFPTTELHTSRWMLRNQLCVTFQRHPGIGGARCRPPLETGLPCSNTECVSSRIVQSLTLSSRGGSARATKGAAGFRCRARGLSPAPRTVLAASLVIYALCTVSVCVFFPFILDIKFVGCTSRGRTGGRSHRISHPPSFCGACLNFSREKDSAIPFPRRCVLTI